MGSGHRAISIGLLTYRHITSLHVRRPRSSTMKESSWTHVVLPNQYISARARLKAKLRRLARAANWLPDVVWPAAAERAARLLPPQRENGPQRQATNWCTNFNYSLGLGFGDGLGLWLSSPFGTSSTIRAWARVRVLGYGSGVRGMEKQSHVTARWRVI